MQLIKYCNGSFINIIQYIIVYYYYLWIDYVLINNITIVIYRATTKGYLYQLIHEWPVQYDVFIELIVVAINYTSNDLNMICINLVAALIWCVIKHLVNKYS